MNDSHDRPRLVSDRASSDDAAVARLLRLAGHRPAVPTRDAEIVKQAARAQWLRAVAARRRGTFAYRGAGGLLAAAALVLLVLNTDLRHRIRRGFARPVATVAAVDGRVWAGGWWVVKPEAVGGPGSQLAELDLEDGLLPGAVVETGGGRLALRLAGGRSLRLDVGTRARVLSAGALALDRGAVYVDTGTGIAALAGSIEIHTELGVARDVGTQFEVRLDDAANSLTVRVREGTVILERPAGSHRAEARPSPRSSDSGRKCVGAELTVLPDSALESEEIECHGPLWRWLLEVLPPFAVDDPSVAEVLEWAARESGWQLSYADSVLEQQAAAVTLEGSIDDELTLEQAADLAVMACDCGLSNRLEAGVLRVGPAAEAP